MKVKITADSIQQVVNGNKISINSNSSFEIDSLGDDIVLELKEDLILNMRKLIAKNSIDKVFEGLFSELHDNNAALNYVTYLSSRYEKLMNEKSKNIISFEEYELVYSRITNNLIQLIHK